MCIQNSSIIKEFQNLNEKATTGHANLHLQEKHRSNNTKKKSRIFYNRPYRNLKNMKKKLQKSHPA